MFVCLVVCWRLGNQYSSEPPAGFMRVNGKIVYYLDLGCVLYWEKAERGSGNKREIQLYEDKKKVLFFQNHTLDGP
jgi:hypothetical protein